jgi:hypothetical protein
MSTLRISNIEAKSVPASATIDEKVKITNSSGDVLVFLDGKTSGITTVGINTTDGNITFDANSNVVVTGIITATRFSGQITPTSLEIGSNIKLGNAGVITATSFVGSGAQLTGITSPAITSIDNDAVSRVLTTDGDGTATAHSEVKIETVSGNKRFSINRGTGSTEVPLLVRRTDASGIVAEFSNSSGYGVYIGQNGATGEGYIRTATGQPLVFTTNAGSGIANARLRIGSSGETTLFRLNTFPNPNNTGSEILGSKLVFGSNISLEERYPNGAYVDRQDLVLRTNTGYGQGLSDKIRFTSGGTINFEVSGGGIDFSATSNSSGTMSSELLADYEEGSWTPLLYYNSGTSQPSYSFQYGHYIRVGKQVTAWFNLGITSFSGTSFSQAYIGGLPFQSNDPNGQWKYLNHMMGYEYASGWGDGGADNHMFLAIYDNQTKMMINHEGNHLSTGQIGNNQRFSCTVTYQTD